MVIIAFLAAHMIGLRQYQVLSTKCGASDTSRSVLSQLPRDIRSTKMWWIGNYNMGSGTFSQISDGTAQEGTALQLFQTTNDSTPYILYYFDLTGSNNNNGKLMRYNSINATTVCLASNLVNWLGMGYSFKAEKFDGTRCTNEGTATAYKSLICTRLQFCRFEYPLAVVGTNGLYDFYKLEFRATPHLPE